ncbi:hypothetical protein [Adhaeribacter soli]|uniref:Uncharacterized protein n=1 Tax=Adhaeribacter soli TaxID=2607655 RepID=A0A5N1IXS4_9BACT|nr:hypothetical protein [Adhaeribacter soli]KAA9338908.1 hypothetical protein F0P94_08945 [Adhaeribacter soli]
MAAKIRLFCYRQLKQTAMKIGIKPDSAVFQPAILAFFIPDLTKPDLRIASNKKPGCISNRAFSI